MATYDEGEAIEIITQAAASMAGSDRYNPAREKAATALLDALKGLNGKAGFSVAPARPNEGGFIVAVKAGNSVPTRAWVGADENGTIFIRVLALRGDTGAGALIEVKGLRLTTDQLQLEGVEEDGYYQPEPGKPRRHRSALAVLVEAIIRAMQ